MRAWIGAAGAAAVAWAAGAADTVSLDGFAAKVNDRVVTVGDVLQRMAPVERQLRLRYGPEDVAGRLQQAYTNALDQLVERALVLEEGKRREIEIPDRAVEGYITQIVDDRFGGNRAALLDVLAGDRLTMADFRRETRDNLAVMMLRRSEVAARLRVPPTAVRRAYEASLEQYATPESAMLRMIVLHQGKTPGEREAKRAEAENLRQRILEGGEDFGAVAHAHSEGMHAAEGGDWGWIRPADLRPELASAVAALAPGEVSPILEAETEFYLVKLEGRRLPTVKPFEEVQEELAGRLREAEGERMYREWIDKLRNRHHVRVLAPDYPAL